MPELLRMLIAGVCAGCITNRVLYGRFTPPPRWRPSWDWLVFDALLVSLVYLAREHHA